MDFITDLFLNAHNDHVYNSVLIIINQYIKIAYYLFIIKLIDVCSLADFMYHHIFLMFSWPEGIISDRGSVFISSYWFAVYEHIKVKRHLSITFHPQMNNQTEQQNSTLKQYLKCFCNWKQNDWAEFLTLTEFVYNCSKHASTGLAFYEVLYGYLPELETNLSETQGRDIPDAQNHVRKLEAMQKELENKLVKV